MWIGPGLLGSRFAIRYSRNSDVWNVNADKMKQLFAPLVQGALWGWATIFLSATGVALRASLYPARHTPRGRITGGPGGSTSTAGGGEAVGGEWWRKWVKSWFGGVETSAVI